MDEKIQDDVIHRFTEKRESEEEILRKQKIAYYTIPTLIDFNGDAVHSDNRYLKQMWDTMSESELVKRFEIHFNPDRSGVFVDGYNDIVSMPNCYDKATEHVRRALEPCKTVFQATLVAQGFYDLMHQYDLEWKRDCRSAFMEINYVFNYHCFHLCAETFIKKVGPTPKIKTMVTQGLKSCKQGSFKEIFLKSLKSNLQGSAEPDKAMVKRAIEMIPKMQNVRKSAITPLKVAKLLTRKDKKRFPPSVSDDVVEGLKNEGIYAFNNHDFGDLYTLCRNACCDAVIAEFLKRKPDMYASNVQTRAQKRSRN